MRTSDMNEPAVTTDNPQDETTSSSATDVADKTMVWWKYHLITVIKTMTAHRRWGYLVIVLLMSSLLTGVLVYITTQTASNSQSVMTNLHRINQLQSTMHTIQTTVTQTSQMNANEKQAVNRQLHDIEQRVIQLADKSQEGSVQAIAKLTATLQSRQTDITHRIDALNQTIHDLKTQLLPKPTTDANTLPFTVVAVDPWNGQPYVEVAQRDHPTRIHYAGLYEIVSGWKVVALDPMAKTATFVNHQDQLIHIKVTP